MNYTTFYSRLLLVVSCIILPLLPSDTPRYTPSDYGPFRDILIVEQLRVLMEKDDVEAFKTYMTQQDIELTYNPSNLDMPSDVYGFPDCPLARLALKHNAGNILKYIGSQRDLDIGIIQLSYAARHECHKALVALSLCASDHLLYDNFLLAITENRWRKENIVDHTLFPERVRKLSDISHCFQRAYECDAWYVAYRLVSSGVKPSLPPFNRRLFLPALLYVEYNNTLIDEVDKQTPSSTDATFELLEHYTTCLKALKSKQTLNWKFLLQFVSFAQRCKDPVYTENNGTTLLNLLIEISMWVPHGLHRIYRLAQEWHQSKQGEHPLLAPSQDSREHSLIRYMFDLHLPVELFQKHLQSFETPIFLSLLSSLGVIKKYAQHAQTSEAYTAEKRSVIQSHYEYKGCSRAKYEQLLRHRNAFLGLHNKQGNGLTADTLKHVMSFL